MGLDMYLNARRYYYHDDTPTIEGVPHGYHINNIEVGVTSWRKANAIHQWFVENVQNGEDNCVPHSVTRDDLKALVDTCKTVIAEPEKAPELLPTTDGFFFGGTEYGEYYFDCLNYTVEQVEKAMTGFSEEWVFEYQSSW